jgi:hypothetical protein
MRAEKKVMDLAMKTGVGRSKLKETIPPDTPARRILDALVHFVTLDDAKGGGAAVAADLEANILKLLVKFMVLHKYNTLDRAEMTKGRPTMLAACRTIVAMGASPAVADERAPELVRILHEFKGVAARVLRPHVTGNTIAKLESLFDYMGDVSRVRRLFLSDPDRTAICESVQSVLPELEAREELALEGSASDATRAPSKAMRLLGLGADPGSLGRAHSATVSMDSEESRLSLGDFLTELNINADPDAVPEEDA